MDPVAHRDATEEFERHSSTNRARRTRWTHNQPHADVTQRAQQEGGAQSAALLNASRVAAAAAEKFYFSSSFLPALRLSQFNIVLNTSA
jgi:hypothetical protein